MMRKQSTLTFDEHAVLGKELYAMRQVIFGTLNQVCRSYGTASKSANLVDRLCNALDKLRCELDNQLCRDFPDKFDTDIYYPGLSTWIEKLTPACQSVPDGPGGAIGCKGVSYVSP